MKTHLIGIGECIMSDLAAALYQQGHQVTGSDVSFTKPSLYTLESAALVPKQPGWFVQKITQSLDKVVVGKQVSSDNLELKAAQQLGLPIYSYPEYIYDYAQDKQRIVIIGSKETTLICGLVLYVLTFLHKAFDYVVDASDLKTSVRLSDAPIIILKGNVEPSSSIDSQPQSLQYRHHMALISDISWEHSSTYPTLDAYLEQVTRLADASPKGGTLIYNEENDLVEAMGSQARTDVKRVPYQVHTHQYKDDQLYLITPKGPIPFREKHTASMCAIAGAQQLLRNLAVSDHQFYEALATFFVN